MDVNLSLSIGRVVPEPVPREIAEALQSVDVTLTDEGPSGFQLHFNAERSSSFSQDYPLLSSPMLKPWNRVLMTVTMAGIPQVLMDGMITHQQLMPGEGERGGTLTVTGEDLSVLMDLVEYPLEYPAMPDAAIVLVVLGKYAAFGILPVIIPPMSTIVPLPIENTPQQNGTDRNYLNQLAGKYGYLFYVRPGPAPLTSTGYWGPPNRLGAPQKAISVDVGPATNVQNISFEYDATAPTLMTGMVEDYFVEATVPVVTLASTRLPPLASEPALDVNLPFVRYNLFKDPRPSAILAYDSAQALTNQSVDNVVVVRGQLDAVRCGEMLKAPGIVGVRGAGFSYDGNYYVKSVSHSLSRGEYKQSFTLTREGLGSLTPEVVP